MNIPHKGFGHFRGGFIPEPADIQLKTVKKLSGFGLGENKRERVNIPHKGFGHFRGGFSRSLRIFNLKRACEY